METIFFYGLYVLIWPAITLGVLILIRPLAKVIEQARN